MLANQKSIHDGLLISTLSEDQQAMQRKLSHLIDRFEEVLGTNGFKKLIKNSSKQGGGGGASNLLRNREAGMVVNLQNDIEDFLTEAKTLISGFTTKSSSWM